MTKALIAVIFLFFIGNTAPADTITGCLTHKGKIFKAQVGERPIKPCKGKEKEISLGGGGPTNELVLMDSDPEGPKLFGQVLSTQMASLIGGASGRITARVGYVGKGGETRYVGFWISGGEIIETRPLEFDGIDCEGNVYFRHHGTPDPYFQIFEPSVIARDLDRTVKLWVGLQGEPLRDVQIKSRIERGHDTCANVSYTMQVYPAELLDDDLYSTYPPPYTLQVR